MTITEFAVARNKPPQTIGRYILRHKEVQKYTKRNGKVVELMPEAVKMLNEIYPLKEPVEVIDKLEDIATQRELKETKEKLDKAKDLIIKLQADKSSLQEEIAETKAAVLLLEDRTTQLKEAKEKIEEANQKTREALEEIERLKNRSLLMRILNK